MCKVLRVRPAPPSTQGTIVFRLPLLLRVPPTGAVTTDPSGMSPLPTTANRKYLLSSHSVPGPVLGAEGLGEQGGATPAPSLWRAKEWTD